MHKSEFNPWIHVDNYDADAFSEESSELRQWPIKLWKAPKVSPFYHRAHLLIAADCSAFAYPGFHEKYARGRVLLTCCPETDFDVASKLSEILRHNDILSVTLLKTDKSCCRDLLPHVMQALHHSRLPLPLQVSTLFIEAEEVD